MADKVVSIDDKKKRCLNSNRLASKYPRIEREFWDLRPEYIVPEKRPFNPPDMDGMQYAVTKEEPFEGYRLEYKADLELELHTFNPVLLYRMMKMMYGDPDIVGAYIKSPETAEARKTVYLGGGVNWSYTLNGGGSILIEIRTRNSNTRFEMMIWDNQRSISNDDSKTIAKKFLHDIEEDIAKNQHLFAYSDTNNSHTDVIINIFASQYKSAEYLLLLAKTYDSRPKRHELTFDEKLDVVTSGSIYCSAALFYMMSFESLLGLFYKVLKRDEYKSDVYDRLTTKADLPSRLLSMHFCNYSASF